MLEFNFVSNTKFAEVNINILGLRFKVFRAEEEEGDAISGLQTTPNSPSNSTTVDKTAELPLSQVPSPLVIQVERVLSDPSYD